MVSSFLPDALDGSTVAQEDERGLKGSGFRLGERPIVGAQGLCCRRLSPSYARCALAFAGAGPVRFVTGRALPPVRAASGCALGCRTSFDRGPLSSRGVSATLEPTNNNSSSADPRTLPHSRSTVRGSLVEGKLAGTQLRHEHQRLTRTDAKCSRFNTSAKPNAARRSQVQRGPVNGSARTENPRSGARQRHDRTPRAPRRHRRGRQLIDGDIQSCRLA